MVLVALRWPLKSWVGDILKGIMCSVLVSQFLIGVHGDGVLLQVFVGRTTGILFSSFEEHRINCLCPVRILRVYMDRPNDFRSADHLFVSWATAHKGKLHTGSWRL